MKHESNYAGEQNKIKHYTVLVTADNSLED